MRTRGKLIAVLALASAALSSPSCGGSDVAGGSGASGGAAMAGAGGATTAGTGGAAGSAGSGRDGGDRGDVATGDVTSDVQGSDAPSVLGMCTFDVNDCPPGYQCGCGGPGPGVCECHKKCESASDCSAPNAMCGCSPTDQVKICVSLCFCLCG